MIWNWAISCQMPPQTCVYNLDKTQRLRCLKTAPSIQILQSQSEPPLAKERKEGTLHGEAGGAA